MTPCPICGQNHTPTCLELDEWWADFLAPSPLMRLLAPDVEREPLTGRSLDDLANEATLERMWALPARDPSRTQP